MKKNYRLIFIFLVLFSFLFFNVSKTLAGVDGSGNNFMFKPSMPFGYTPPGKFWSPDFFTFQTWNHTFDNNGHVVPTSPKFGPFSITKEIFLAEAIWTFKFLDLDNYFQVVVPAGSVSQNITNTLASTKDGAFSNSATGIGDTLLYYGIYAYHGASGILSYNVFPEVSLTVPDGNWNSNSPVNIGGDEWQIQPTLTGQFAVKTAGKQSLVLNYALGWSKNEGHSSINMGSLAVGNPSYTQPGNNIFADFYLDYIISPKLYIYNETAYTRQYDNYGYTNSTPASSTITPSYGLLNKGYQDIATGGGLAYHYSPKLLLDGRVLKDIHGENGPDGWYGMVDAVFFF